ncbi:NAD(P)H-dependent oxidoreductase [Pseudaminobacter manganicus]|uniref:NADPH-dependent FMN reductase n=1 Tax=Manganibacter manganicus TaxID=1873176 RepID=UPI0019583AB0
MTISRAILKDHIDASEAVLFVTPEYNRSIPSTIKNAVDWASRPWGQNALGRQADRHCRNLTWQHRLRGAQSHNHAHSRSNRHGAARGLSRLARRPDRGRRHGPGDATRAFARSYLDRLAT